VYGVAPGEDIVAGLNAIMAVPTGKDRGDACELVTPSLLTAITTNGNVAVAVWLLESVTVTVILACAAAAVGVPVITPVESMLSPAGNVAVNFRGAVPPVAVTGCRAGVAGIAVDVYRVTSAVDPVAVGFGTAATVPPAPAARVTVTDPV
jgi:hypothetical protein